MNQYFMDILTPKTLMIKATSLAEAADLAMFLKDKGEVLTCVRPVGEAPYLLIGPDPKEAA